MKFLRYVAAIVLMFDILLAPLIALLAIWGRYPKWFVAPDDPIPPFGLYEPDMRRCYYGTETPPAGTVSWSHQFGGIPVEILWPKPSGWRRWWGDFVWLGWRNRMMGASYALKPKELYPSDGSEFEVYRKRLVPAGTYRHIKCSSRTSGRVTVYEAAGWKMWKVYICDIKGHPFGIMFGLKVDSIVTDRSTVRKPINLEARPICSIRRLD